MLAKVLNWKRDEVSEVELDSNIFGINIPDPHLIKRVVDWQRSCKMSGNHKKKNISEVSGTGRKPFAQKGTGNARAGSKRAVHMRGGAVAHAIRTRSHSTDLPKKIKKLGLYHALSDKFASNKVYILDKFDLESHKTSGLSKILKEYWMSKSQFVVCSDINSNFALATRNIFNITVVPPQGINVYDVLKHDVLMLDLKSVELLQNIVKK
jgi:large subunit ribosomal protein L4